MAVRPDRTGCAAHAVCEWEASVAGQEERGLHAGSDPGGKPSDWPGFPVLVDPDWTGRRSPAWIESLVVGPLAVRREVETVAFGRFGDAGAAEQHLDDQHGDGGDDAGPDDRDYDGLELDEHLAADVLEQAEAAQRRVA